MKLINSKEQRYKMLIESLRLVASNYDVQTKSFPGFVHIPDEVALILNDVLLLNEESNLITENKDSHRIVGLIPKELKTKEDLLENFSDIFNFPGYFGKNWDAFRDILLHWDQYPHVSEIYIVHQDIPLKNDEKNLQIYLDILSEAISNQSKKCLVKVFFPESARTTLYKK